MTDIYERRDVIGAGLLLAMVAGVPLSAAPPADGAGREEPTDRQRTIARQVAQLLIPRTDTPGGADVGADNFLVLALAHGLDGSRTPSSGNAIQGANSAYHRQDGSLDHLGWLEHELDRRAGDFVTAPLARQQAALDQIDRAAFANPGAAAPWATIKGLLLTGYYTSQIGGSQELRYKLVPGRFDADISLRPADHAWSSDWTAVEFG